MCAGLKAIADMGLPVDGLTFDPAVAVRGLIVDTSKGNLLKVDRFGLVKRAMHGSKMLAPLDVQKEYGRELVQLSDTSRWCFLNTLFSVSEGCLFMQVPPRPLPTAAPDSGPPLRPLLLPWVQPLPPAHPAGTLYVCTLACCPCLTYKLLSPTRRSLTSAG